MKQQLMIAIAKKFVNLNADEKKAAVAFIKRK